MEGMLWQRSSMVITSLASPAPDLWLTDDQFVGKLYAVDSAFHPSESILIDYGDGDH